MRLNFNLFTRRLTLASFALFASLGILSPAQAMNTAASFDVSYAYTNLGLKAIKKTDSTILLDKTVSSPSGYQIDYNVALYDLKTIVTASFLQFISSNLGRFPVSRVGIGVSYHFLRMNGQRVVLDNGVEGKIWGVSPAVELSAGFTKLNIKDPERPQTVDFSASMLDIIPRVIFEIPMNSSLLLLLRAGVMTSMTSAGGVQPYTITYSGAIFNIGIKLTNL